MSAPDDVRPSGPGGAPEGVAAPEEGRGLCRDLRTKRYYYAPVGEPGAAFDTSSTAQYWCLRTMRVVGPDEAAVSPEACRRGRSCCRPDEL
jgi:hypothetical protein